MTEHEKLCKEMVSKLACIFVGGHLYLLKDVQIKYRRWDTSKALYGFLIRLFLREFFFEKITIVLDVCKNLGSSFSSAKGLRGV